MISSAPTFPGMPPRGASRYRVRSIPPEGLPMTYDDQPVVARRMPITVVLAVSLLFLAAICMLVDGVIVLVHLGAFAHAERVITENCLAQKKSNCGTINENVSNERGAELAIGIVLVLLGLGLGTLARFARRPSRWLRTATWGVALFGLMCFGCGGLGLGGVSIPSDDGKTYSTTLFGMMALVLLLTGTLGLLFGLIMLFLPSTRGFYSGVPYVPKGQRIDAAAADGPAARTTTSPRLGATRTATGSGGTKSAGVKATGTKSAGVKATGTKTAGGTATGPSAEAPVKNAAPATKASPAKKTSASRNAVPSQEASSDAVAPEAVSPADADTTESTD